MNITNSVIHQIITDAIFDVRGDGGAEVVRKKEAEGPHDLEDVSQLVVLANLLEKRIRSAGKGSSKLKDPQKASSTSKHLRNYIEGTISFFDFSLEVLEILRANTPPTATGGYLSFLEYDVEGKKRLFICMLKLEDGVTIDATSMQVRDATSIQANAIHEGARFNRELLGEHILDANKEPTYIDWIKTKQAQRLSAYFQGIFEIDIEVDNKVQTTLFRKAVDDFIETASETFEEDGASDTDLEQKRYSIAHSIKTDVYDMINTHASNSQSIDFSDVEKLINAGLSSYDIETEKTFTEFADDKYTDLNNLFKPFSGISKKWGIHKCIVKDESGTSQIKFYVDQSMVTNTEYFSYDENDKTVTIKKVDSKFYEGLK